MALCGNCGAQESRVRTKWASNGAQLPDECPACAPQSFERFRSVRDGTIAMGWEYMPTKYKLRDGVYAATDELRQDTEDEISKVPEDEIEAYKKAVARKRVERRTQPLSLGETQSAIQWYRNIEEEARESGKSVESN